MRGAVLADADRVVGKNVKIGKLRECAEPNSSAAIIGKHHERSARCTEQPVIRNAVEDGAHAVLAYPKTNIAPCEIVAIKIATVLDVIHCRSVQIGAAADQQRH